MRTRKAGRAHGRARARQTTLATPMDSIRIRPQGGPAGAIPHAGAESRHRPGRWEPEDSGAPAEPPVGAGHGGTGTAATYKDAKLLDGFGGTPRSVSVVSRPGAGHAPREA